MTTLSLKTAAFNLILERIAELAIKHDLLVLSDEIYEKIVYPPAEHASITTFQDMRERTILLNGFSKFYSMTGWRLGYVLGPSELVNPILRYHQYMITSTNTFAQWGAVTALKGSQEPSHAMVREFQKRRDYMYEAINKIPGFRCPKPDGAFYLFPSIKETGMDGFKMAEMLSPAFPAVSLRNGCMLLSHFSKIIYYEINFVVPLDTPVQHFPNKKLRY